jgi:hypothetical protein
MFIALFCVCSASTALGGPIGLMYANNHGTNNIDVIQGTGIIATWTTGFAASNKQVLAVDSTVRTMGWYSPGGGEFTLDGTKTALTTGSEPTIGPWESYSYDGTTDGTYNYSVRWDGTDTLVSNVYRFASDWTNPELLFVVPDLSAMGITFDPTNLRDPLI